MIGVGQQLGGYTILKRIGHGGLGEVYLAQHRRVARRAAVKVLLPELAKKETVLEQFFKEARNTSLIKHPGIVEILDCDLVDGQPFIITEFLEGESLGGYLLRTGTLEQDLAFLLGVAAAAAGAVGAAHLAGIMHRDLKPENIYLQLAAPLDPGVTVKVLDFGISKLSREDGGPSQTSSGMLLASPTYMSPEQCRGVGRPDARSDIYSLGCVLYEALCGRPPFTGLGLADLIEAHVSAPPRPPARCVAGLFPKLNSFILRMLAKEPAERPQTMAHVVTTLRECARAMGIDFDGQLQPLTPVQRPTNLAPAAPLPPAAAVSAMPQSLPVPERARVEPKPIEPGHEARPAASAASTPASSAAQHGSQGLVGKTMFLNGSPISGGREASARPGAEGAIRAIVGGTMVMERSEGPPAESYETSEESWGASRTGSSMWLHHAVRVRKRQPLLVIVAGAAILIAAFTVILSTGGETPPRLAKPWTRSNVVPTEPTPDEAISATVPSVAPPAETPPTGLATVQIDIQGLGPQTVVTLDGQPITPPIRIRRGPQIHRIGLRPPTGSERTIEIDGARDRVIELVADRKATKRMPTGRPDP